MLSARIKSGVSAAVKRKGHTYQIAGRVSLLRGNDPGFIESNVRGTKVYQVSLLIERFRQHWEISADCSCPYIQNYLQPCKHIWATILEAEAKNRLTGAPRDVQIHLANEDDEYGGDSSFEPYDNDDDYHEDEEESGDDDGWVDSDFDAPSARSGRWSRAGADSHPRKKKKAQAGWESIIRDLAKNVQSSADDFRAHKPVEPVYILNVDRARPDHELCIQILNKLKSPEPGRITGKALALEPNLIPRLTTDVDRRIILALAGASACRSSCGGYYYGRYGASMAFDSRGWSIPGEIRRELIAWLVETGRFYVQWPDSPGALTKIVVDRGEPWDAVLKIDKSSARRYEVTIGLRRGGVSRDVGPAFEIFSGDPAFVISGDELLQINLHQCEEWFSEIRAAAPITVPARKAEQFIATLASAKSLPPVAWPADWKIHAAPEAPPTPCLYLVIGDEEKRTSSRHADAFVRFDYDGRIVEPQDPGAIILDHPGRREISRMRAVEERHTARAMEAGVDASPYGGRRVLARRIPAIVAALLSEGWRVHGDKALFRRPGDISVQATTGIDWFELAGGVDFGGVSATLPELLAAHRRGEKFVKLGDGTLGMLPGEWLLRHGALLQLGEAEDGRLRFAASQVSVLDAMLAEMPEASFDAELAAARKKLASFDGVRPAKTHKKFHGDLRPYQSLGLGWLRFLADFRWGGCLADDMGLGKTVQVLSRLAEVHADRKGPPSLAVVPRSLIFNWMREAERFSPSLRVLDYSGTARKDLAGAFAEHDLILTTYGTLRRDVQSLRKREFHYVILDEAQAIKNPEAQSAKAVRLLTAQHRLAMTGTPVENHLGDLWSIFQFLNPGMLGPHSGFKSGFLAASGDDQGTRLERLHKMLRPFILRRTKDVVAPELPPRSEQVLECKLPPQQRRYYDELRDFYRASLNKQIESQGLARSKIVVLEALLRLRQAACHPGLIDKSKASAESAKLEMLLPMLEELLDGGHKALVFSQFTSFLSILKKSLDQRMIKYEYLDGQTRQRQACVDRFQQDAECRLFLISLKAGGTGLNLTAADYVFILDPWWNPAVEAQAIDRTHRIGQDKQVIAYRLIAKDTVESRILELQKTKSALAGAIVTQANSLISKLSPEDLAMLLT